MPTCIICCLFDNSHFDVYKVRSDYGFDIISLVIKMLSIFMYEKKMPNQVFCPILSIYLLIFAFFFLRATPVAYGISQARSWIRDAAAGLCHSHSNTRSLPTEVRDWTYILMDAYWVHYHWANSFCPILNHVICVFDMSCMSSFYISDINPLSDIPLVNIFSHSVGCLFVY